MDTEFKPSTYQKIKDQIPYRAGRVKIVCPNCGKEAHSDTTQKEKRWSRSGMVPMRHTETTCVHCHCSYDFVW